MKKTAKVIDQDDDNIEYNIFEEDVNEGVEYSIARTKSIVWSTNVREEIVLTVVDDGNGLIFSNDLKTMDYDIAHCLKLLLFYIDNQQTIPTNDLIIEL